MVLGLLRARPGPACRDHRLTAAGRSRRTPRPPPALVVVAENDVLRDEGEAYARKLLQAGVPTTSIRYNATLHDFMMLNLLRGTHAATAAVEQAVRALRTALRTG